jgi:MFS family permease
VRAISGGARAQLGILSVAIVLGMAPWFAATVVAQGMALEFAISIGQQPWLTLGVQLGFVLGSLISASFLLSDRVSARRLAAICAGIAALTTGALTFPGVGVSGVIGLRILTGAALAGVYPPGIKLAAGWTESHRGTAIGILVGAVTLGSGAPHLLRLTGDLDNWRPVILGAATSALLSALVFWLGAREGPFQSPTTPFDPRALGRVLRDRGVLLATGGYLGHMWELYAMWSTLGLFMADTVRRHGHRPPTAPLLTFIIIGVGGAIGCLGAGMWADRVGKSRVTIVAMAVSATCALTIGSLAMVSFPGTVIVAIIWGIAVVADSAQFSTCVTMLAPHGYVGTAVTAQTALGFLLTMLTIRLVPTWEAAWGWQWAYAPLAIGPALGILAMWRLWIERRI